MYFSIFLSFYYLLNLGAITVAYNIIIIVIYIIKDYRTGMNEQLTKFAYKNTATDDLRESISAASSKAVVMVMGTWNSKIG